MTDFTTFALERRDGIAIVTFSQRRRQPPAGGMLGAPHPMDAYRVDSRAINTRGAAADARKGIVSFMERRDPDFVNSLANEMPELFTDPEPELR